MAKSKEDDNVNMENSAVENQEVEGKKKKSKKQPLPKTEEELYVETLTKAERKEYEKRKRALRRSQWIAEYWIIIILAVAVLVLVCVLMAINYFDWSAEDFYCAKPLSRLIQFLR